MGLVCSIAWAIWDCGNQWMFKGQKQQISYVLNKAMTHCFRRETPREIEPAMHRWHPPQKFVPALYDPKIVVGFVFGWSLQFKEEL